MQRTTDTVEMGDAPWPCPYRLLKPFMNAATLPEIAENLLKFSPDALLAIDQSGIIRFANSTVRELFGYSPEELIGRTLETLVPERLRSVHAQHVTSYRSAPRNREMGAYVADLLARRADGSEFPAGIRLAPFQVHGDTYVAAAVRDMTEQRKIVDALAMARADADSANLAKSRFLAAASHDLRQPLQTIRLLNASLMKLAGDPQLTALIERQSEAIGIMTRQLNGLLDISRFESGTVERQLTDVEILEVFDELRREFEPLTRSRQLSFKVEPIDLVLLTDRTLFRQLLENLLGNAVKYTDQGGVELRAFETEDSLEIVISDTGVGIPEDKLDRIFDEYYQLDAKGQRRMGVGLGLAIVREVARLLGYSIEISSTLGQGTKVVLRIPRENLVANRAEAPQPEPAPSDSPNDKPHLLLAEDNDSIRRAMELFLTLEGYRVKSAATAEEAEKLLEEANGNEILITDYHLDGSKTGMDLAAFARRLFDRFCVIVLSGDLSSVARDAAFPATHTRFLSKPVEIQTLVGAIAELDNVGSTHSDRSTAR